jgi:hypothetical protein
VIFLRGYQAFSFYLRSEPWLILEILILGSEPVVSSSGLEPRELTRLGLYDVDG